ncbi:hypothetical protein DSECCO2_206550 [anaerobic digester metagenome]
MSNDRVFTQEDVNNIVSKRLVEEKGKFSNEYKEKYEALEKTIAEEKAEAERIQKEQIAEADFSNRFAMLTKEKAFVNDFTKDGVYSLFKKALSDPENSSKPDGEIYETIVKDKNYYKNPNSPADMPGMGNVDQGDSDIRQAMGLMR